MKKSISILVFLLTACGTFAPAHVTVLSSPATQAQYETFTALPPSLTSFPSLMPADIPVQTAPPLPVEITDAKGVSMRLVPAGEFIMGSDRADADEKPVHTVPLGGYYMDTYEVTNALYKTCVDAGICQPPEQNDSYTDTSYYGNSRYDDYPVIYVNWNMTVKYCEWRAGRLPSEAEWEKAARGTDGLTFPWGEEIGCDMANYNTCKGDTTEVGSYPGGRSSYGIYDLGGNVWEWVSSLYQPYPYKAGDGREDLTASGYRVRRGGSWGFDDASIRSAGRSWDSMTISYGFLGFRCAKSIP